MVRDSPCGDLLLLQRSQEVIDHDEGDCLIHHLVLLERYEFGGNAKVLLPLVNNKWPPEVDPGGHRFVVLNVSINNTPVSVSAVVDYKKKPNSRIILRNGVVCTLATENI